MATSCHVGRGLVLLAEDEHGVELEGSCRLAPGRAVVVFGLAPAPARGRQAYVVTWRVMGWGRGGPIYRGYCEWLGSGHQPPGRVSSGSERRP